MSVSSYLLSMATILDGIQTHKTLITFSLYIKLRTTTTLEGCMNTVTFCKSTFLLTFYVSRVCAIKLLSGMQKWYNFISFCDTRYLSRSRLLLTPITSALWSRNTERFSLTYYLWGLLLCLVLYFTMSVFFKSIYCKNGVLCRLRSVCEC